ncbi:radical SAM family heme chaperone HemW [Nocardioides lianchengensis]|uniref:Heme chaperone HemW n=1 Tax=Nocardioides lianchengensis TaxID=1045774 RepID=A0A1G6WVU3_9ACTN|nr:radical SAM family heme chaperone HemW [Nocardioides lianchengensis]NYG09180.1 oxygen-independent coproporphyrinogen-3 oxidase [Nocardioides lianchengensis]SDD70070.1 oxygen-independent coproporphyrinogen-3 oxidase [Nocardioides lianchengensis]
MPSALPAGDPVPADGTLPETALAELGQRSFGFYVHVPFCTVRCGYCDFNTYTAEELGPVGGAPGASRATYAEAAITEVRRARAVLGDVDLPVSTVFFGGGTPTLLSAADLGSVVAAIAAEFGLADDAEVTTESNPDSVALWDLEELRAVGINRLSFGMQSSVDHVLKVLDRTHDPLRVPAAVQWARQAGFDNVSLDLIYGTPGESVADWEASVEAALACAPDHVSAYSLIVEDGTALARQVRRGELPMPDEDDLADKYQLADERFEAAGLGWYEVSNWSTGPATRCRHNLLYWTGADWWGVGPGAHSHVGGVRWWNVKHPAAYADRLAADRSPAHARELLGQEDRRVEQVLLELRLRDGLPVNVLDRAGRAAVGGLVADGLLTIASERLVLTPRGRLLADAVVRDLLP